MLRYQADMDAVFRALADPSRRAIVEALVERPFSVSALAGRLSLSVPGTMQHLAVLDAAKLVETTKTGRVRTVALKADGLRALENWAETQRSRWERKLDHLAAYLDETKPETERD